MLARVIVSCCLLWLSSLVQAQTVIRAVVDEWAPFGGEALPNRGISLDVMTTVLTRAGYQVEAEIVPWERALNGVKNGTYDVIGNLFYDAELAKELAFTQAFYKTTVHFLRQKGSAVSYTDLNSLKSYSIAVGEGYLYEDAFDRATFLDKQAVTTVQQGVRMVASGRVDLTLDSKDVLNYIIHQQEPALADKVELLPTALAEQAIHMAVRKDFPNRQQLISDFNRVLQEMEADGTLSSLLEKHQYQ